MKVALTLQGLEPVDYSYFYNLLERPDPKDVDDNFNQVKKILAQMKKAAPIFYKYLMTIRKEDVHFSGEGFTGAMLVLLFLQDKGVDLGDIFRKIDPTLNAKQLGLPHYKVIGDEFLKVISFLENRCDEFNSIINRINIIMDERISMGMLIITFFLLRAEGSIQ